MSERRPKPRKKPPEPSKPVAGYYRVSHARDGTQAPEIYEKDIRRWCDYREVKLKQIFSDIDYSGFNRSEARPALAELVRRRTEFSSVIIPKLSRFGRSLQHLTRLFQTFDQDGISLVFLDLGMDTSTSQGRLLRNIMGAFAEYESDVKADYSRANHRHVRSQGKPWGGTAPHGYKVHPSERSYVIDDRLAGGMREVFRRYLEGSSQREIRRYLQAHHPKPSGAPWKLNHIGRILDNPAYAGLVIVDDELIDAVWEPLIDRETWDAVRARRREDRAKYGGQAHHVYLLSGLIFCGRCGRRLYHRPNRHTKNGKYLCVEILTGRLCPGGGVDTARADRFVSEAFLQKGRFIVTERAGGKVEERGWSALTLEEQRRLLGLALERVVVVPWPDEGRPRGIPRELTIQWYENTNDLLALQVAAPAEPRKARDIANGRPGEMRKLDAKKKEELFNARSERSKKAWREWKDRRLSMIAEQRQELFGQGRDSGRRQEEGLR